jgi:hypothetical protein
LENLFEINGNLISVAEQSSDPSRKIAKFLLCPLDEANANGKGIKESDLTAEELNTLVGQPLVTKVIFNEKTKQYDFSGHLRKQVYKIDDNGNVIKFSDFTSTNPIGYHTEVNIEDVQFGDVSKRCLVASVTLWTRYYRAMEVIDRLGENLHTSWELSYENSYSENGVEWLKGILFLANCCLGTDITPAYRDAGLLEVAEEQEDELAMAMLEDINNINQNESIQSDNDSVENKLNEQDKGGIVDMAEIKNKTEMSSLNTADLRSKVTSAIYATEGNNRYYYGVIVYPYDFVAYAQLDSQDSVSDDYTKFTFVVNSDDTISLTSQEDVKMVFVSKVQNEEQIAELQKQLDEANVSLSEKEVELSTKIDEIVKLGETIQSQKDTIAEKEDVIAQLEPIRQQMEQAEAEKKEAEIAEKKENLRQMALTSKYFTEAEIEASEDMKKAIEELDEKQIKCLIAEKVVEVASKVEVEKKEVSETSEKEIEVSTDLNAEQQYDYSVTGNPLMDILKNKKKRRR